MKLEYDSVTCKDSHWYDLYLAIGLIIFGILNPFFAGGDEIGLVGKIVFGGLIFLLSVFVGIDMIGGHFFRQITVNNEEVIYRNSRGKTTKKNWNEVQVEYKPKRYKQTEQFVFITGPEAWESWVINCEYTDFDKLKAFLLRRQLDRLVKSDIS
ncbi:MAG: hypothetical protein IKR99_04485 [Lachnospiraceae bacterium]|nr:hypothetical protein [Lachnospiraceae bacterium]